MERGAAVDHASGELQQNRRDRVRTVRLGGELEVHEKLIEQEATRRHDLSCRGRCWWAAGDEGRRDAQPKGVVTVVARLHEHVPLAPEDRRLDHGVQEREVGIGVRQHVLGNLLRQEGVRGGLRHLDPACNPRQPAVHGVFREFPDSRSAIHSLHAYESAIAEEEGRRVVCLLDRRPGVLRHVGKLAVVHLDRREPCLCLQRVDVMSPTRARRFQSATCLSP